MKTIIKYILIIFILLCLGAGIRFFVFTNTANTPSREFGDDSTPTFNLVAFGDSLTAGYGLDIEESYPAQLEKRLLEEGYSVSVQNAGVSGETTSGNLARAPLVRALNPDVVILGIGGNDALRLVAIETIYEQMSATLRILTSGTNPPRVILLEIQAPINGGFGYKRSFDDMYEQLSDEFDIPLVPFVVSEVFANRAYMQSDGIHPNADGYAYLIREYIYDVASETLDDLKK